MTRKRTELDDACIMAKRLGVSLWTSAKPTGNVWWLETRYTRTRQPTMHYSLE